MSKTHENIKSALLGESQARNKYFFYANKARQEGYHYIAKILEETAENEKYHALSLYKLLHDEKSTADNLESAIEEERFESMEMYPQFAKEAEVEGHKHAAVLFDQIAKIERHHQERFEKLLKMIEANTVYRREKAIRWKCSICGYTHEGCEPPPRCPYCKYKKEYYEPANLDV